MNDLQRIYVFSSLNKLGSAWDILSEMIQEMLVKKEFEECRRFLQNIEIDRLSPILCVAILEITFGNKDELEPERITYYKNVLQTYHQLKETLQKYE